MKQPQKTEGKKLAWYFPEAVASLKGFYDPLLQHFEGNHARAIAREIIQNSLDAAKDLSKPVRVEFERSVVSVRDLEGLEHLENPISKAKEFVKKQPEAVEFYKRALEVLKSGQVPMLRVSDFNTKGLHGKDDEIDLPWVQLTLSSGMSVKEGGEGGTFGIGKGAPFVASMFRVVYYRTYNKNKESIFLGKCRLSSFKNNDDYYHDGEGCFGLTNPKGRFLSVRDAGMIPAVFHPRNESGTDIYIAGYDACEDSWEDDLISSVLDNFWAAIHFGDLIVSFTDSKKKIEVTSANLKDFIIKYDNAEESLLPFYEAVTAKDQILRQDDLPHLGAVSFYLRISDNYPKQIQLMRRSKMFIEMFAPRDLRDPYAGVFICESEEGNELLRMLEPPAHDKWDRDRQEYGKKVTDELRGWIKKCLKDIAGETRGKPEEIPEINKYLPELGEDDDEPVSSGNRKNADDDHESGKERGKEQEKKEIDPSFSPKRNVAVVKSGIKKKNPKPTPPGPPSPNPVHVPGQEKGSYPRINTASLDFRSFAVNGKIGLEYQIVITSSDSQKGAIKIITFGEDAEYEAEIKEAKNFLTGKSYKTDGSFVTELSLKPNEPLQLRVSLKNNRRYILGIESYEA